MPKGKKRSKVEIQLLKYSKTYKTWGKVYCPVFKRMVFFTRKGWGHLFEEKSRSKMQILARARLLPFAKKIISITTTLQEKRLQRYHQHYSFLAYTEGKNGDKIKVVIVEDKKKIYFLSVFKM